MSKEKTSSAKELSPEIQLEIRREVEDRLTHLPADTLKLIQSEVEERVSLREKHYRQMTVIVVACFALVCVAFFKVTWDSVTTQVAELIAKTPFQQKTKEITEAHQIAVDNSQKLKAVATEFSETEVALKARLQELKKSDNLVTYDHSSGLVVLNPRNGGIKLQQAGATNSYIVIRIDPRDAGLQVEQGLDGKVQFTGFQGFITN